MENNVLTFLCDDKILRFKLMQVYGMNLIFSVGIISFVFFKFFLKAISRIMADKVYTSAEFKRERDSFHVSNHEMIERVFMYIIVLNVKNMGNIS